MRSILAMLAIVLGLASSSAFAQGLGQGGHPDFPNQGFGQWVYLDSIRFTAGGPGLVSAQVFPSVYARQIVLEAPGGCATVLQAAVNLDRFRPGPVLRRTLPLTFITQRAVGGFRQALYTIGNQQTPSVLIDGVLLNLRPFSFQSACNINVYAR